MITFIELIRLNYLLFGFDPDGRFAMYPRITKLIVVWRYLNPFLLAVGFVQLLVNIILGVGVETTRGIVMLYAQLMLWVIGVATYMTMIFVTTAALDKILKIEGIYLRICGFDAQIEDEPIVKKIYSWASRWYFGGLIPVLIMGVATITRSIVCSMTQQKVDFDGIMMKFWFPFDADNYPVFVTVYSYMLFLSIFVGTCMITMLVLITSSYLAVCFERLADNFREIFCGNAKNLDDQRCKLGLNIDLHNELIEMVMEANRSYGMYCLSYFTIIAVDIGLLAAGALAGNSEDFSMLIGSVGNSFEMFLYCWAGQLLADSSSKIFQVISESEFYKLDETLRKSIILIEQVSSQPREISAVGFFELNLHTFLTMIQAAYTYLGALKALLKKK